MNLRETKMVLDWAKAKLDNDKGARIAFPEQFELTSRIYQEVKDKYDKECSLWVTKKIPGFFLDENGKLKYSDELIKNKV